MSRCDLMNKILNFSILFIILLKSPALCEHTGVYSSRIVSNQPVLISQCKIKKFFLFLQIFFNIYVYEISNKVL
jgi:hypothetical protein